MRKLQRYIYIRYVYSSLFLLTNLSPQVGYAGENFPRAIFPSMVGRPVLRAEEAVAEGVELRDIMCGDEVRRGGSVRALEWGEWGGRGGVVLGGGTGMVWGAVTRNPVIYPSTFPLAVSNSLRSPHSPNARTQAAAVRHSLECSYPVENGIVKNWEDMEEVRNCLVAQRRVKNVLIPFVI